MAFQVYLTDPFEGGGYFLPNFDQEKSELIRLVLSTHEPVYQNPNHAYWQTQRRIEEEGETYPLVAKLMNLELEDLKHLASLSARIFGAYQVEGLLFRIDILKCLIPFLPEAREKIFRWTEKVFPISYSVENQKVGARACTTAIVYITSLGDITSVENKAFMKELKATCKQSRKRKLSPEQMAVELSSHCLDFKGIRLGLNSFRNCLLVMDKDESPV